MPITTIEVYRNGSPASGIKVMLSFVTSGVSPSVRTNGQGIATIAHSASGTATIFVDGRDKGKMRAPGRQSFSI